jgi:hypothetical protein
VDTLIREDRRLTLAHVADIVAFSHGSAQAIVHDDLGYHKVCALWVPKQFTAQHKQQRVDVATRFLQHYEEDPSILERIVQQAVQTRLHEQPKSFSFEGTKKLVELYQKCIIVQGDYLYVEK